MIHGEMSTRTSWIVNTGIGSLSFHKWPYGFYLVRSPLYTTQNLHISTSLYFLGSLVIHSNPYYSKHASNLGNSVIPVIVTLSSKYNTRLIFLVGSLYSPSVNVFYMPRYPHHSIMKAGAVVSASRGSFISIGITSTSYVPGEFSKLTSLELDFVSSDSEDVWGG